ncbi:MAG TPA: alpha/beta fold hydrolase [Candidatus Binatia bacterium]|jgi:pimeloyl-ACP methyl ester carboxylesterase|nr:alpha/beta fold hydrolase [Candidatus Binatia bacterium]
MNYQTQILTFTTAHNERLHGALLTPPNKKSDTALIFVHGVAMNFYLPPLFNFGQELSQRGHHSFIINTRGHDWISRAGNLSKFGGSAYENLEDCLPDLDGALDYLQQQGYRRFVLIGHSLGAIKSIIYQGTRQRADVVGIVSCSAPKQFYSERIARQPQFRELIEQAEAMVAEGRGEELMSISVGATPGIFSARSHLNKYGKDDRNDCRPYAKLIGCPLLAIVGSAEPKFFYEYAQEIAAGAAPHGTCKLVDGANHFYHRHTAEIVEIVYQWLAQFKN